MAKTKKPTTVQASDSEESSPLPQLTNKKKPNNSNVNVASKPKTGTKPVPKKDESEEETPVESKKKVVKPPRKGSKASVDEEPVINNKKGSADKAPKKVTKPKSQSQDQEEQKPKKTQKEVKKPLKPSREQSSSSESSEQVKPKAQIAKPKQKKNQPVQSQQDEIVAPKKPATVTKKDVKQAKQVAKNRSSSSQQQVKKPVPVKKVVKPIKKDTSSQQQQEQPKPRKGSKQVVKAQTKKPIKPVQSDQQSEQQVKPVRKGSKQAVKLEPKKKVIKPKSQSEQQEEEPEPEPKKKPATKKVQENTGVKTRKGSGQNLTKKVPQKVQEQDEQGEFEVAVQGLSFNAFDGDIRDLFNPCGNIINVKTINRPDGKPKGFAFVKFSSKASFNKALELNGTEHMGRSIRVEQARGNANKGGEQRGGNANGGGRNNAPGTAVIQTPTLYVGGLSYSSTVDSIKQMFSSVGEVQSVRVITDRQTGKPRGFGYVQFYDVQTAKKAYNELNGQYLDGRAIRLDSAAQRENKNQRPGGFGGGGFGGGFQRDNNRQGSSVVSLSQEDRAAKKGAISSFAGKKIQL